MLMLYKLIIDLLCFEILLFGIHICLQLLFPILHCQLIDLFLFNINCDPNLLDLEMIVITFDSREKKKSTFTYMALSRLKLNISNHKVVNGTQLHQ